MRVAQLWDYSSQPFLAQRTFRIDMRSDVIPAAARATRNEPDTSGSFADNARPKVKQYEQLRA